MQHQVAHDVEGGRQFAGALELRDVELEDFELTRQQGLGYLLHGERLAGPGRAEHGDRERPPETLAAPVAVDVLAHDVAHAAHALDLAAVHRRPGADRLNGDAGQHAVGPVQSRLGGDALHVALAQHLDEDAPVAARLEVQAHAGQTVAAGEQRVGHLGHREAQTGPLRPARLLEARRLQGAGAGKTAGGGGRHVGRRTGGGDLTGQGRRKAGEVADHAARMAFVPVALLRARVEDQRAAAVPRDDDHARQPHLYDHPRGRRKPRAAHGLDDLLVICSHESG